jgi:hypothetical protein
MKSRRFMLVPAGRKEASYPLRPAFWKGLGAPVPAASPDGPLILLLRAPCRTAANRRWGARTRLSRCKNGHAPVGSTSHQMRPSAQRQFVYFCSKVASVGVGPIDAPDIAVVVEYVIVFVRTGARRWRGEGQAASALTDCRYRGRRYGRGGGALVENVACIKATKESKSLSVREAAGAAPSLAVSARVLGLRTPDS